MARKPNKPNEAALQMLRQQVRMKSGLPCHSLSEMQLLHDDIAAVVGEFLSLQTLARFFSLSNTPFQPAAYTLLILAKYTGYNTFEEIEQLVNHNHQFEKGSVARFISGMFRGIDVAGSSDDTLQLLFENIHSFIEHDEDLCVTVYRFMASSAFGRRHFFERLLHIDRLDGHFGNALHDYLVYARTIGEKIFARSLLGLRYFLMDDRDGFEQTYQQMRSLAVVSIEFSPEITARFYAMQLFACYYAIDGLTFDELLTSVMLNQALIASPDACMIVAEALILVKQYDEAWICLQQTEMVNRLHSTHSPTLSNQYELFRAFAGFFAGKIHALRVKPLVRKIRSAQLPALSLHYLTLYLDVLDLYTQRPLHGNLYTDINHIINKTGFLYFRELVEAVVPEPNLI